MMNQVRKYAPLVAVVALVATSCGGDESSSEPERDPYEVYLENAPAGGEEISREDAQTRAMLGCGEDFAPGTIDAVLADAYTEQCESR